MVIDPRKRFRDSPQAKAWADAVATEWFQAGVLASLNAMVMERGNSTDMGTAAAMQCRIEGAQMLIHTMTRLTDTLPETKRSDLPHNLKEVK